MKNLVIPVSFVVVMLVALAAYAHFRKPDAHRAALVEAGRQLRALALRIPFALIAAECIGRLLPTENVSALLGADAGFSGVLFASAVGAFLPGGPMVAFPLAIALFRAGATNAPLVALMTAWSMMAVNRMLMFEVPLLGARFAFGRVVVSAPMPIIAGLLAAQISAWLIIS